MGWCVGGCLLDSPLCSWSWGHYDLSRWGLCVGRGNRGHGAHGRWGCGSVIPLVGLSLYPRPNRPNRPNLQVRARFRGVL